MIRRYRKHKLFIPRTYLYFLVKNQPLGSDLDMLALRIDDPNNAENVPDAYGGSKLIALMFRILQDVKDGIGLVFLIDKIHLDTMIWKGICGIQTGICGNGQILEKAFYTRPTR